MQKSRKAKDKDDIHFAEISGKLNNHYVIYKFQEVNESFIKLLRNFNYSIA